MESDSEYWDSSPSSEDESEAEDVSGESPKLRKRKARMATFCCCLCLMMFIAVVVTGAWLSADTSEATSSQIAGYALLTVAGIVFAVLFFGCCAMCAAACGGGSLSWGSEGKDFDPNDVHQRRKHSKFVFTRWNDEYKRDAAQHEALLKLTAKALPKDARAALKKANKVKKEQAKKSKTETDLFLVQTIKSELEKVKDPNTVLRKLRKRVYVIDFNAAANSSVLRLAEQVSLVLKVANPETDKVVIRINSPGGYVAVYGLAASQLIRFRNAKIHLIACVDEVAASGGYMMCCVANEVCAAPFAFVGSIGVVTLIPNFDRVTKAHKVDVYEFTAGKYKRTVDMFGEVTEEGKLKLKEELELIHANFKRHVKLFRADRVADIETVATGEGWLATDALPLGLVDRLETSDDILANFVKDHDVLVLSDWRNPSENWLREWFTSDNSPLTNAASFFAGTRQSVSDMFTRMSGGKAGGYARVENDVSATV